MDDNKSKALAAALSQIEKQFGKGSVMRMGESDIAKDIQAVSTGSLGLDIGLGIGGLPRGRVVEIYGPESSGKTTLTLSVIAQMQKLGGTAAFIDAEHALDPQYAGKLSVEEQARQIDGASGVSGVNVDYLASTVAHLDEMGIKDGPLHEVWRLLGEPSA